MDATLALFLATFGALLVVAVFLDDIAARIRLPGILMVLVLGLLVDNRVDLAVPHTAAEPSPVEPLLTLAHAQEITQVALVLVLFFGGLTTNWRQMRSVLRPASRLATAGALLTALLITVVILAAMESPLLSRPVNLPLALFVGAMLCSTDASAVLALLRPLTDRLPKRLLDLIEAESAFNDPMAVVLAGLALALAGGDSAEPAVLVAAVLRQFLLGILLGFLGGTLAHQLLLSRPSISDSSLLAVVSLALLMLIAGGTEALGGSGLLAAYIAGLVIGNSSRLDRGVLEEAHAGFAKMAELLLFLCMGLVVAPPDVVRLLPMGLGLFVLLLLVRLVMVHGLLMGAGFSVPERHFACCVGLRGAVPIAVAIQAADSSIPWGAWMPALALTVVLFGLLIQGFTLVPLAEWLGLAAPLPQPRPEPPHP
ncbi:sodium:proton antiporter [Synechococcus sp. RSCCF101]|uniref:cation:proton antiporter domain-containing protein n=1 Tax=Synechococcus sp. RSCCF101 TaxID=2511069 RepID=UPI0012440F4D|nr:cation:proton antiporter [Synechococcus sp. RSCCF101]QEY32908.1 sodium:proton antiporter [Synechococcus sp. RSCCF101]